ncbi:carboxymuconolactone decarboxylase family protein [Pacificispira sp.]|uniref:carboxymuconolactone decarboxylase family protein n=1 Tax=Pacificispira sp. TaxID=2888761 RepID=UPI003B529024
MTWVKTVAYDDASDRLRTLYDRVSGPGGKIDNIMMAHSLRPHTMEGHMALYKAVLHHFGNDVPKWVLETIGIYVSLLNGCAYCVDHHFAGLKRLLRGAERADRIRAALEAGRPSDALDRQTARALDYAEKLTRTPQAVSAADIQTLRDAGFTDGQILEINQVTAYFAYANRTVLGLGVDTAGDVLGLSPGDGTDPDNWTHG